jgi:hypothetical protein
VRVIDAIHHAGGDIDQPNTPIIVIAAEGAVMIKAAACERPAA